MIADLVIQRLRAKGLTVVDLRSSLPRRNYTWMTRQVSSIRRIAIHHDAVDVTHGYDPLSRYIAEANYHAYVKVWDIENGQPIYGDGLMYHMKLAADGRVFITRNFEDITWHVGSPNGTALGICCDGNFINGNMPFQEQLRTLSIVLNVLTTECPEFPAARPDIWGHKEFVQFGGTATECPGSMTPFVDSYRTTGAYDVTAGTIYNQGQVLQPAPVSVPPVLPPTQPIPQPPVDPIQPPSPTPPAAPTTFNVKVQDAYDGLRIRVDHAETGAVIGLYFKGTVHEVHSQTVLDSQGRQWYQLTQMYPGNRPLFIAAWAVDKI